MVHALMTIGNLLLQAATVQGLRCNPIRAPVNLSSGVRIMNNNAKSNLARLRAQQARIANSARLAVHSAQ
eukprot:10598-Heterococcus_DN1.PRE.1